MDRESLADLLASIVRGAGQALGLLLPWVMRAAIIGLCIYIATGSLVATWRGLGGTAIAMLPALVVALFPLALVLTDMPETDDIWGRLVVGSAAMWLVGKTMTWLGDWAGFVPPALLIFCVIILFIRKEGGSDEPG